MEKFVGKWEATSSENMGEMLKAFDMDEAKRKMYESMKFVMEYTWDGTNGTYTVHMPGGMSKQYPFQLDNQFDSTTLDGRPITSSIKLDDGKLVEMHRDKADPTLDATMVREIVGEELIVTATVKGVTSVTRHKRV